jgi:putative membrane protein
MNRRPYLVYAAVAAIVLIFGAQTSAFAASSAPDDIFEREVLQAKLSPTGDVRQTRLYSQLTMVGDGTYTVTDPTATEGLRNLQGFGKPSVEDGQAVWNVAVDGKRALRTVSDYSGDLPVSVAVSYELDGESISPDDLVGRSGTLVATYTIKNESSEPTELTYEDAYGETRTETTDLPLPLAGQFESTLPKNFSDVTAEGGVVAGDGRGNTKLKWTLILFEPLGDLEQTLSYTAQVTDVSLPPATVQVVPVTIDQTPLSSGNAAYTDAVESTLELTEGATTIDTNLLKIADGAGQLLDGLVRLADGAGELNDGLNVAAPGSQQLAAGASDAADGGRQLSTGLGELSGGAIRLSDGLEQARSGSQQLADGLKAAPPGAREIRDGVKGLRDGVGKAGDDAEDETVIGGLNAVQGGLGLVREQQTNTKGCNFDNRKGVAACGMKQIGDKLELTLGGLGDTLTKELDSNLEQGLSDNLGPALKGNLETALEDNLSEALNDKVKPALAASLKQGLETALGGALNNQVKPALTQSLKQGLEAALQTALEAQLKNALINQVKPALLTQLESGIASGLESTLNAQLEPAIATNLSQYLQLPSTLNLPQAQADPLAQAFADAFTPTFAANLAPAFAAGTKASFGAALDPAFNGFAETFAATLAPAFADAFATGFGAQVTPSLDAFATAFATGFADGFAAQVGPSFDAFGTAFAEQFSPAFGDGLTAAFADEFASGFGEKFGGGFESAAFEPLAALSGAVSLKSQGTADALSDKLSPGVVALLNGLNNGSCDRGNPTDEDNPCGVRQILELLAAGSGELASGLDDAAAGSGELAGGIGQLDEGAEQLAMGANRAAGGGGELATGLGQLRDGATQLSDGLVRAAAGSGRLADGLTKAEDGGGQVADGAKQLSEQGTSKLASSVNDANAEQSRNVALVQAMDARSKADGMPAGAPEGATSSAVYAFELAGADGTQQQNATRLGLTGAAVVAMAGLGLLRRRLLGA